jgi:hypothetical protein
MTKKARKSRRRREPYLISDGEREMVMRKADRLVRRGLKMGGPGWEQRS